MKKLRSSRGMTLMEVLVSILILVLLVIGMGTGMNSGMEVFQVSRFEANSASLAGIIDTALGDTLRHAETIHLTKDRGDFVIPEDQYVQFVFTSVKAGVEDAYLYIETGDDAAGTLRMKSIRKTGAPVELVNSGAYPDLKIDSFKIDYVEPDEERMLRGGYFVVEYDICSKVDPTYVRNVHTIIRLLNTD